MNVKNAIQAVDTHTAGMSTRVIISGFPVLRGKTMMEKKNSLLSAEIIALTTLISLACIPVCAVFLHSYYGL